MPSELGEIEVRPAATVVVLREGAALEVLLLKRASTLAFFGGAWVFPGGRVDPGDGDLGDPHALRDAARQAAVRELHEESGLQVEPSALVAFTRWLTPPGSARRFDTFYFAVAAPDHAEVKLDPSEASDYSWLQPSAALAARARGELELPPPTFVTLSLLDGSRDLAEALRALHTAPSSFVPAPIQVPTGIVYLYEGDAGYASQDPQQPGARHRLSTLSEGWRYDRPT
ncbi:MAG: NUDIX hydrolase [Polyangiales bacterium]